MTVGFYASTQSTEGDRAAPDFYDNATTQSVAAAPVPFRSNVL
jgi:hypothetical protein